ncbi:unnamed protein product [Vitrella brassicaformis CCMP3155]|uniref:Uncharacterized protein n=3 Tax=Vitrella brassicaformis TaxID=1169539 RepID=A0A0G4FB42_VITBC|nr:unnamed protein product [Vitrella brassicaformis CCMP3155]|mmetsp:Transcript_205/g.651  ORF Transcript_205/g.651 Transcript_205/m.651 type:complete len:379 (-) Transcript_205:468-1604(-)|eukprot:CEM09852.1 unnamed protein product [Vitrella brassicaformis CCMP3155]
MREGRLKSKRLVTTAEELFAAGSDPAPSAESQSGPRLFWCPKCMEIHDANTHHHQPPGEEGWEFQPEAGYERPMTKIRNSLRTRPKKTIDVDWIDHKRDLRGLEDPDDIDYHIHGYDKRIRRKKKNAKQQQRKKPPAVVESNGYVPADLKKADAGAAKASSDELPMEEAADAEVQQEGDIPPANTDTNTESKRPRRTPKPPKWMELDFKVKKTTTKKTTTKRAAPTPRKLSSIGEKDSRPHSSKRRTQHQQKQKQQQQQQQEQQQQQGPPMMFPMPLPVLVPGLPLATALPVGSFPVTGMPSYAQHYYARHPGAADEGGTAQGLVQQAAPAREGTQEGPQASSADASGGTPRPSSGAAGEGGLTDEEVLMLCAPAQDD